MFYFACKLNFPAEQSLLSEIYLTNYLRIKQLKEPYFISLAFRTATPILDASTCQSKANYPIRLTVLPKPCGVETEALYIRWTVKILSFLGRSIAKITYIDSRSSKRIKLVIKRLFLLTLCLLIPRFPRATQMQQNLLIPRFPQAYVFLPLLMNSSCLLPV